MNELINVLCGVAMCVVVYAPVMYYGGWNLLLWLYKVGTEFITSGDKRVYPDYKDADYDGLIWFLFISGAAAAVHIVITLLAFFVIEKEQQAVLWAFYNFGVFCSPVISFVLIGVAIMFGMKYSYKLNKFSKQLKEHVADKDVHK